MITGRLHVSIQYCLNCKRMEILRRTKVSKQILIIVNVRRMNILIDKETISFGHMNETI